MSDTSKQFILHTERHKVVLNSNAIGESYVQFFIDKERKSELAPFSFLDDNMALKITIEEV